MAKETDNAGKESEKTLGKTKAGARNPQRGGGKSSDKEKGKGKGKKS